jgi:hypothetical protein
VTQVAVWVYDGKGSYHCPVKGCVHVEPLRTPDATRAAQDRHMLAAHFTRQ